MENKKEKIKVDEQEYSKTVKLDKFYTKETVVKELMKNINVSDFKTVIEPSAGCGAFSDNITHNNLIAIDIEPENINIKKQDWFEYEIEKKDPEKILVVGNPPFGLRCKLAKDFVTKAVKLGAHTIAFVLPDVFQKPTYDKIAPGYNLKQIIKLADNSFEVQGEEMDIPCSFFIWTKDVCEDLTWKKGTHTTDDFVFIKPDEYNPKEDIIIKQAISKEMVVDETHKNKSGRHFIRPLKVKKKILEMVFKDMDFKGYSAVNGGVIALCQEEVIKNYNEYMEEE